MESKKANTWLEFPDKTKYQKEWENSMFQKGHELRQRELEKVFKPILSSEIIPDANVLDFIVKNEIDRKLTMGQIYWLASKDSSYKGSSACLDMIQYGMGNDDREKNIADEIGNVKSFNKNQRELYLECLANVRLELVALVNENLLNFDESDHTKIKFEMIQKKDRKGNPIINPETEEIEMVSSFQRIRRAIRKALMDNRHFSTVGNETYIVDFVAIEEMLNDQGENIAEKVISEKNPLYLGKLMEFNDNSLLDLELYGPDFKANKSSRAYGQMIVLFDSYMKKNYFKDYEKLHRVWYSLFKGKKTIPERAEVSGLSKNTQGKYERMILGTWDSKTKRRNNGIVQEFKKAYDLTTILNLLPKNHTFTKCTYNGTVFHNPLGDKFSNNQVPNRYFKKRKDFDSFQAAQDYLECVELATRIMRKGFKETYQPSYIDEWVKDGMKVSYRPIGFGNYTRYTVYDVKYSDGTKGTEICINLMPFEKPVPRKKELVEFIERLSNEKKDNPRTYEKPMWDYPDMKEKVRLSKERKAKIKAKEKSNELLKAFCDYRNDMYIPKYVADYKNELLVEIKKDYKSGSQVIEKVYRLESGHLVETEVKPEVMGSEKVYKDDKGRIYRYSVNELYYH